MTTAENEASDLSRFLQSNIAFLAPDEEIMRDHRMAARSPSEEAALRDGGDPHLYGEIRRYLQGALDDSFDISENMVVAPGGRFGDMTTAIFTASGDHAMSSTRGVIGFCSCLHYPIRFVRKYFENDASVGAGEGDCFLFNDPFYGGLHTPDQSAFMPVYHEGVIVAWVCIGLHQGEDGAKEPGGMGPAIESPFDEGLKMPPIKMAEAYRMRTDVLTFLQNSCRDPRMQGADMKMRLNTCMRLEEAIKKVVADYGVQALIGALRQNIEFVADEVKRRIEALPPARVRGQMFLDSTMREDALLRLHLETYVENGKLILDFRGSSPQIGNRPINAPLTMMKVLISMSFLCFVWPDLPRVNAVLEHVELRTDPRTIADCTRDVPTVLSMQVLFKGITLTHVLAAKLYYSARQQYSKIIAPWFNQTMTFLYGGITQHNDLTGNLCADLNGMPGGAHCDSDGEHSMTPNFSAMCDVGESELAEQDLPFVQMIAKIFPTDNVGFGKFRGGAGHQTSVAMRGSPLWGFSAIAGGSKFSSVPGLFGGYGSPTYPVCRVKGINIFEEINKSGGFLADIEHIMNDRPYAGGIYTASRGAMPYEFCKEGELYLTSQGAGGGYGDVLDRDPHLVMKDFREGLISERTIRDIYHVAYDERSLIADATATREKRAGEREARKARGVPFETFVKKWVAEKPPEHLPYYGGWGKDHGRLFADGVEMRSEDIGMIMLPDPRDVYIAQLEERFARLNSTGASDAEI